MSFILDALKKSEIERQRQAEPGLMDAGIRQRRGRLPVWALLLGALLTINIVVLLIMVMRNGALATRPTPAHAGALPAAGAAHFSPLDAPPVYAPEIPIAAVTGASATGTSATDGSAARLPSPYVAPSRTPASRAAARALRQPDPVLTQDRADGAGAAVSAAEDNGEALPSISEINLTGAQALPDLHLDVHVYATKPSDRFVYINMRKYKEGALLPEGPKIELIRRDGVVLNYQGLRFLLPRQS